MGGGRVWKRGVRGGGACMSRGVHSRGGRGWQRGHAWQGGVRGGDGGMRGMKDGH